MSFDPFKTAWSHITEATRDRKRIVRWHMNDAAYLAIMDDERAPRNHAHELLANPRKFFGIPFDPEPGPDDAEPVLEPVLEKYGRRDLIHDYSGSMRAYE